MKLPVALALVVGVIGVVITYLYVGPLAGLGLLVPVTFLGAASFFAAGGDRPALTKSLAANIWGVVCGTITLILLGFAGNAFVVALIVGAMTAVFILGALVPILGFVPGSVIGFAPTVMFGLLTKASGTDFSLPSGPFTVLLLSIVIGGLYGYVSALLVGRLTAASTSAV